MSQRPGGMRSGSRSVTSGWGEKFKAAIKKRSEAKAARGEKREARKEVRGKKRAARKDSRAAVKEIRSKGRPGAKRRAEVLATKAYNKTDKEGDKGGMKAFGKFTSSKRAKRLGEAAGRQKARREARETRQAKRAKKGLTD